MSPAQRHQLETLQDERHRAQQQVRGLEIGVHLATRRADVAELDLESVQEALKKSRTENAAVLEEIQSQHLGRSLLGFLYWSLISEFGFCTWAAAITVLERSRLPGDLARSLKLPMAVAVALATISVGGLLLKLIAGVTAAVRSEDFEPSGPRVLLLFLVVGGVTLVGGLGFACFESDQQGETWMVGVAFLIVTSGPSVGAGVLLSLIAGWRSR